MINHLFYVKLIVLKNLIIISSSCELIVLLVDVVSKFVSRESMAVFNDYNTVINVELVWLDVGTIYEGTSNILLNTIAKHIRQEYTSWWVNASQSVEQL